MRNVFTLILLILAVGLLIAIPGFAADVPVDAELDHLVEEPLMTPADQPDSPDLTDPSQGLLEDKIQWCEGPHPECPPGCECAAITVTRVYCTCP